MSAKGRKVAQQNIFELKPSWSTRPASPSEPELFRSSVQEKHTFRCLELSLTWTLLSIFNHKHPESIILLWFDLTLQNLHMDLTEFLKNSKSRYGRGSGTNKILNLLGGSISKVKCFFYFGYIKMIFFTAYYLDISWFNTTFYEVTFYLYLFAKVFLINNEIAPGENCLLVSFIQFLIGHLRWSRTWECSPRT